MINSIERTLTENLTGENARAAGRNDGQCTICEQGIKPGERIADRPNRRGSAHVACLAAVRTR